jgi:hypothetical protein
MNRILIGALLFAATAALSYGVSFSILASEAPQIVEPTVTPAATSTPQATATSTAQARPASNEKKLSVYTTGYTYWDNTPPGSSIIAFSKSDGYPTVHSAAGGAGTYADPITLAVGHVIKDGKDTPDYKPGTRFYIPSLSRYFIVEDTCGDGDAPQDIPCHTDIDHPGVVQLDVWLGGAQATSESADACARALTGIRLAIENPEPTYPATPGELLQNGTCAQAQ